MSLYNEDELEAPDWLTKEFLQTILQEYEKEDNLEVTELNVSPATVKGDHFASCVFRASIEYRLTTDKPTSKRALIIKTLPSLDTLKRKMLLESKLFETEIGMYTETLPLIEQILAEYGDHTSFAPKVIYSALQPNKIIILEDLCEAGYETVRGRYLHMDELKATLLKLAKLHAVSYKLSKAEKSERVTHYRHGILSNPRTFDNEVMSSGIKNFVKMLESNDELRVYLPQFQAIRERLFVKCQEFFCAYQNGITDEIFVLNHGDFHMKNLMLKYDAEKRYEDVMLVDFQFSVFAPSILDLTYATYMMFDPETRHNSEDEIMRFYFENFIATLKKIDYQGELPTFGKFQMTRIKYPDFGHFLLTTFLPMIFMLAYMKSEDIKNVDASKDPLESNIMKKVYESPGFIEEVKILLRNLLNRGFLD